MTTPRVERLLKAYRLLAAEPGGEVRHARLRRQMLLVLPQLTAAERASYEAALRAMRAEPREVRP